MALAIILPSSLANVRIVKILCGAVMWGFLKAEDGAVTVDWVVLTAATMGLGLASVTAVRTGTTSLGDSIMTVLSDARPAEVALHYAPTALTQAFIDNWYASYENIDSETLLSWHEGRVDAMRSAIARGHNTATGDTSNLSARENLDVLFMHTQVLQQRNLYPVPGLPTFQELRREYQSAVDAGLI